MKAQNKVITVRTSQLPRELLEKAFREIASKKDKQAQTKGANTSAGA